MKYTADQKERIYKEGLEELPRGNSYNKDQVNLQEYIDMVKKPVERYETFESKLNTMEL